MKKLLAFVGVIGLIGAGVALAQSYPPPQVSNVGTTDLIQIVPNGNPSVGNQYATPQQIAGVPGYVNLGVATSGNTYTYTNSQIFMLMQPSGTLAAVTLTTAPNPSDGQRECFLSTQTTTSLTWNANTGQTMGPTITAGVANTAICITYVKSSATWIRS